MGNSSAVEYRDTTCSRAAWHRGSNQKVVGFSFYGNTSSNSHKSKQYFVGIKENLELIPRLYDKTWTMRWGKIS